MNRPTFILMPVMYAATLAVTSCNSNDVKITTDVPVPTPTANGQNNNSRQSFESGRNYTRGIAGTSPGGASFFTLYSSDGMTFEKSSTDYETPEQATSQLRRKLSKALEIVSREPTKGPNGREVGETVVARFGANNRDAGPASLLWTSGSELFQVDSSSIENILAYRKDFNH